MSKNSLLAAPPRRPSKPAAPPSPWGIQLGSAVVAAVLGAVPVAAWVDSEQHLEFLAIIALPLAAFLAVMGYLGARSILRTPQ